MSGKAGTKRPQFRIGDEHGVVLFLALGIMLILLSLSVMFAGVSISRATITNNQRDAIKARCIAESGVTDALSELADNPASRSDIGDTSFGGGTYSVDVDTVSDTEVLLTSTGEYRNAHYRTRVLVELPPSTGTVYAWALREGASSPSAEDSQHAHDDATGPNTTFAAFTGHGRIEQGLAGFRVRNLPYPIAQVEMVVQYYLPDDLVDGYLELRWRRPSDDKKGSWKRFETAELNAAKDADGHGFIAVQTESSPPGGWRWEVFTPEPDFQIDVKTDDLATAPLLGDTLYVDCAGYRISW